MMLINQVSKATGLTKKAIEYYTLQGLVSPTILENGYREYSQEDVKRLDKISVLRRLDISTDEIKTILSDGTNAALQTISVQKELHLQRNRAKKEILDQLSEGASFSEVRTALQAIDQSKTITEKLLEAFPGYYGRFICLHFARFLNEPIQTEEQQTAYDTILYFLDNIPALGLSPELQDYLTENTQWIGTGQISEIIQRTQTALEDPDDFLATNQEVLEAYWAYKQSEEYRESPFSQIMERMKEFNSQSGYNDVFLPALRQLSSSYSAYYQHLQIANQKLLEQYPELKNLGE